MSIYLDLLMGLNFAVDFLLLLGTNRLAGFPMGLKRAALAAALGAIYSGACILPGLRFLGSTLWRLVSLTLMASIAFGWNRSAWSRTGVFILLSMALGGIALGLGNGSAPMLLAAGVGVWALCHLGFGGRVGREFLPVEVTGRDRKLNLIALRDTGNDLRDPITGEPVMVLGADAAEVLFDLTAAELGRPMETMLSRPGFRLIPYRAVGQPGSMLLAVRTEVHTGGSREKRLVAFAPEPIGRGAGYQALVS